MAARSSKEKEITKKQNEEINQLKKKSAQKEINLNQNLNKEEKELLDRHKKELDDLIKNFDIKIKPKISSYFLQLKTREYFLCKQERYIEADETKKKAQEIYLEDNKFIDDEKKFKLYQKIEELNSKHRMEYFKFIKNKDKKVYYLKKEEDDEKKIINEKYNKQKEDELRLFDLIKGNGLLDAILEAMNEDEYNYLIDMCDQIKEEILEYGNSAGSVIRSFIRDLPKNAEAAKDIVENFDPNQYQAVIDFANAANGGKVIPMK